MSSVEELAMFLSNYYMGIHCDRVDTYNKKMKISMIGNTITGDNIKREFEMGENQAKDLYDILVKGYIISEFGGVEDFTKGLSQTSNLGVEYYIDGRRLSDAEFREIFRKAKSKFVEEYNSLLDKVIALKSNASMQVIRLQTLNWNVQENKGELHRILEENGKFIKAKQLGYRATIPKHDYNEQESINIEDILQIVKKDNKTKVVEPQIVAALNRIITSTNCIVNWPSPSILSDEPSQLNDMIGNYNILKIMEGRFRSIVDKLSNVIEEQEKEAQKIIETIKEIKENSILGITSKEKVEEVILKNELNLDTKGEIPNADVSEESQKHPNNPFVSGSIPSFRYVHDKNKSEIDLVNKKQNELLTYDEKIAINLFKSQMYRAYNKIIRYMKNNGLRLDQLVINDEVIVLLKEAYDELYARKDNKPQTLFDMGSFNPNRELVADNYFASNFYNGIPTFDEYKDTVIRYFPPLMSSLSKITLENDITVYRGVSSGTLDLSGIISTTLDPSVTAMFRDRIPDSEQKAFIRIKLPKGSPVIIFTNNLLERFPKEYDDNLKESQKELAFDSELFELVDYKQSTETTIDENGKHKDIICFDVTLRPKTQVLQQEESGEQRS